MVNIYSLAVDHDLEVNGIEREWFGINLRIARMGNPRYDEEIIRLSSEVAMELGVDPENIPDDKLFEMVKRAAAKCILLGWKNMDDEDGKPIKYSPEKAYEFFTDENLKDMYKFVIMHSKMMENYRRKKVKSSAKNLKASSGGKRSGRVRTKHS